MFGYIYMTINLINGKKYVGQHNKKELDIYYVGTGIHIKKAINKYGRNNFINGIIEYCYSLNELNKRERYWITNYDTFNNGYNLTKGGEGILGIKHSEETKKK